MRGLSDARTRTPGIKCDLAAGGLDVSVDEGLTTQVLVRSPGDLDGDGFEDLVVRVQGRLRIYRGGTDGIRDDRRLELPLPAGFQPDHDSLGGVPRR